MFECALILILHLQNKPVLFRQSGCEAEVGWGPHLLSAQPRLLSDPAGRQAGQGASLHQREHTSCQLGPWDTHPVFCFCVFQPISVSWWRLWAWRPARIASGATVPTKPSCLWGSSWLQLTPWLSRWACVACSDSWIPSAYRQQKKEKKPKKPKPDRNTFICCNMFCWLRGCRAPLTTHVTMCTRQTRSNNYIRSKLNVTKSETQHPSKWSVAQGRPHTSQDNMETFIRAKLMQMCLCNQEPVHPGSWRLCAQKGEQASFHNLNLSLFYAVLFTSQMRIRLWRSVLLALCLLVGSPRPQKHLCNTQLVVGVSPEPGSSQCEFGSSSGW